MNKKTAIVSTLRNSSVDSAGNNYGLKFCIIFSEDIEPETVKKIFNDAWNSAGGYEVLNNTYDYFYTGRGICFNDMGEEDGEGLLAEIVKHAESCGIQVVGRIV